MKQERIFGADFFRLFGEVNEFIAKIKVKVDMNYRADDYHLKGPLDAFDEETIRIVKDVVQLRKKLSSLIFKRTKYFVKQLFDLYDEDRDKGREAVFLLLHLFKNEWEAMEITRIRHAALECQSDQGDKIREDINDLLLYKRLIIRRIK